MEPIAAKSVGQHLDRTVVLVGMMGSGKTSIGRRLAEAMGWPFQDADWAIEYAADLTHYSDETLAQATTWVLMADEGVTEEALEQSLVADAAQGDLGP